MSYMVDHSLKEKAGASGTSVYGIASDSYGDSVFIFVNLTGPQRPTQWDDEARTMNLRIG
ncbi:uncharacterized protein N7518_003701 [Penicillium psychrosexuale]|uniref:uncharacterized protein n=1 Tax=Penicillium psychrosexuale TaxID=1002107 RepID=UPI002544F29E|nr:uncharacterized protein N7518_003701 [Penicillium psychrosexuale]KAJ5801633.1 hypothetical protein N7518_003701 [Penicillium psychrosexuale]